MSEEFWKLISCPICGVSGSINNLHVICCQSCNNTFFQLGGIPCLFPAGIKQKELWNHLLAVFIENGEQATGSLNFQLSKNGLSQLTRERLKNTLRMHELSQGAIINLLQSSGLQPVKNSEYEQYSTKLFLNYYELMLRDWGWAASAAWQSENRKTDENRIALDNILHVMEPVLLNGYRPSRVLFIGAGAGRLSWDIHCLFKPRMTVALDFNPLLASVASGLIKNKDTLHWCEKNQTDENNGPGFFQWPLTCQQQEKHLHDSWFPLLADAWAMPFSAQSFDLIVTPWFVDVMRRDCKDLIALVEKLLVPGGHWLNYGPFLYSDDFNEDCKYTSNELKEFLQLSQFSVIKEEFFQVPYVCSPLTESGRIEKVWCVLTQSSLSRSHLDDGGIYDGLIDRSCLPAWMVMPHLPIPRLNPGLFPSELANIAQLIDGKNSINDLKAYMAPHLPDGYEVGDVIYQLLFDYIVEQKI